jgi:hypothetical protein
MPFTASAIPSIVKYYPVSSIGVATLLRSDPAVEAAIPPPTHVAEKG